MKSITLSEKDIARFWSKVKVGGPNECWECKENAIDKKAGGYGRIGVQGNLYLMHRLSWIVSFGEIKEGVFVCHKCDNRKCVNPNHLFVGTHNDNVQDMVTKNRNVIGESVPNSKLKEEDVIEIRNMLSQGISTREIAQKYKVNCATISKINTKRLWSWLK